MQKEEKIVVVLLLMALGSLAVAFWAFSPEEGGQESSSDSVSQENAAFSVEGLVLEIKPTKSGGNLLLKLDSTQMPIFVPANAGATELLKQVHTGNRVNISGTISKYHGKEELTVSRSTDVVVMGN